VDTNTYTSICVYIHIHTYVFIFIHTYIWIYISMYMTIAASQPVSALLPPLISRSVAFTNGYIFVCIYTYIHTYMFIHNIYVYTHNM